MHVTLIRHGQIPGNAQGRYIGRTDQSLTAAGIAELEAMGADMTVKAVYVSPLRRTRQTAAILFPEAKQTVVDDLREMDFGDFEGRSAAEMAEDGAYRVWVESGCLAPCPKGESKDAFSERICAAFVEILRQAQDETLTFVVHGGTIMAIMERFALPQRGFYDYLVSNGGGYTCDVRWSAQGLPILQNVKEVRHEAKFI